MENMNVLDKFTSSEWEKHKTHIIPTWINVIYLNTYDYIAT